VAALRLLSEQVAIPLDQLARFLAAADAVSACRPLPAADAGARPRDRRV
jgi:hypothetical protein